MDICLECIYCTINRTDSLFSQYEKDEEKKLEFMKKVFNIILTLKKEDTSPYLNSQVIRALNDELDLGDIYHDIKIKYNNLLLSMEGEILNFINNSDDKVLTALKYAMVGNFIDFGAMDSVDVNELKRLIKNAKDQPIDEVEYKNFIGELKNAKKVAYIIDNAGEIVFDKVFIDVIKKTYPEIDIDVIVRGKPIYNDATILDAEDVGMYKIANVIENGTNIPGTQLDKINEKSRHAILSADLIISKGQGNFEGLYGCGKNIYYIFLCKCDLFVKRFNMKKFTGIFANEKNIRNMIAK
ncbi:DUF89 family protein [Clostridium sp. cel8]|jgi:damage-control phosphatase, subfamily I|uniref:damage-control phosphatase ARMT1 family protein n=1 Tax=unclassified Clostridium TaxID=2614128 RepID=UPI0015F35C22|nr:ARMT1-like domain-containing protein [Clostridium sp. cel8]MBA5851512.1 DUF89 family protein [Clostridium sp. cel8]